jgi:hypothetical protein
MQPRWACGYVLVTGILSGPYKGGVLMISRPWSIPVFTLLLFLVAPIPALPASPEDEAAVKAYVQTWVDVTRKQDLDALIALVAPEAKLDSRTARAKVPRDVWAASIKQAKAAGTFGRNQEATLQSLTFPAADKAVLDLETSSVITGTRSGTQTKTEKERWTLTKREGRWVLIEKDYR